MLTIDPWPGLRLVEQITEGNRNEVWRGDLDGQPVAVRQSRRSPASLAWELDLIDWLDSQAFLVPSILRCANGDRTSGGVVVQQWIDGVRPSAADHWKLVADGLTRLHRLTTDYPQRPECCAASELVVHRRSVDADLDAMPNDLGALVIAVFAETAHLPRSVIHGDVGPSNLRITADGRAGFLDWDESRVDVAWHDLSVLGPEVLDTAVLAVDQLRVAQRLSNAWEAVNGWVVEPSYARRRLAQLR